MSVVIDHGNYMGVRGHEKKFFRTYGFHVFVVDSQGVLPRVSLKDTKVVCDLTHNLIGKGISLTVVLCYDGGKGNFLRPGI